MNFKYNGNKTETERLNEVANDIINYYEISDNIAITVAKLEEPITTEKKDIIHFKRLYNILFVLSNQKEYKNTYEKVVSNLKVVYNQIMSNNSTENKDVCFINSIYVELNNYFNGIRNDFPIISEFYQ